MGPLPERDPAGPLSLGGDPAFGLAAVFEDLLGNPKLLILGTTIGTFCGSNLFVPQRCTVGVGGVLLVG